MKRNVNKSPTMNRLPSPYILTANPDEALEEVADFLNRIPDLEQVVGSALRQAIDEVIDGPRTGRFSTSQLEKTEKTYIGTKVEIVLRSQLNLERGSILDNLIRGHEVDTKFSLGESWMIPQEAMGHICLLVSANDSSSSFKLGLLRIQSDVLCAGSNQDKKKGISSRGKTQIRWLISNGQLVPNFLLHLDPSIRETILSQPSGMQRIRSLFTNVTDRVIPRVAIEQVAQQKDPMRRARQMKEILASEGYTVLCSTYRVDRVKFEQLGHSNHAAGDWLSIKHRPTSS